ncbi:MAG: putative peptidyl-prolyl cis-trans isomerase [Planctomycetota bacterium]|jgi:cyclophilin family peptidyl-prolyl cis-trans isomerase
MKTSSRAIVARSLASLQLAAMLTGAMLAQRALAQTLTPIQPPSAPGAAAPARPALPPPVTDSERRFRDLSDYIRTRGEIDATTRADIQRVAEALDADLAKADAPTSTVTRLLAARAQVAIWLDDRAARDGAFERLASMQANKDAVLLAWARELTNGAEFERSLELLEGHTFAANRLVESRIILAACLMAMNRFDDAQSVLNSAPVNRTPEQLARISLLTNRIGSLREMWNAEMVAMSKDQQRGDLPLVELVTPKGAITLELFEDQAPNTVGNFIEHVEAGTYNGTRFHRVLRGFGVQGGDPTTATGGAGGTGSGGWTIPDETLSDSRRNALLGRLIAVSQPNPQAPSEALPNSAGCQFMILVSHNEQLGKQHTVFGRVFDGLDVARALTQDDQILSARVVRKRNHDYRGVRFSTDATGNFTMPLGTGVTTRSLETKVQGPTMTPRPAAAAPVTPVQVTPAPAPK